MSTKPSFVKITAPRTSGIVARERLFALLDECGERPITWISSPGGAGKTSLVASYLEARKRPCLWYQIDAGDTDIATFFYYMGLAARQAAPRFKKSLPLFTPEYLMGVPVFTRRFFEELYSRVKTPFTLVFDNYQEVSADSPFQQIMTTALSVVPEGIKILILSRMDPPSSFIGLRAGEKLSRLGWEDIRFTEHESRQILLQKDKREHTPETHALLHNKAGGWVAILLLLIETAKVKGLDYAVLDKVTPADVFDYFANEIFEKADGSTRDFLLRTAFLPSMTADIAEVLSGNEAAGRILSDLSASNYFTQRHLKEESAYVYHPLFRDFLLTKAKANLNEEEIRALQKRASALLLEAGRIDDAAVLLCQAEEWDSLIALVLQNGESLCLQGRFSTLQAWLMKIPSTLLQKNPWLLYWRGFCKIAFDPVDAHAFFEQALRFFDAEKNSTGVFLTWSRIIESILYKFEDFRPIDKWIQWLEERLRSGLTFPSSEIKAKVSSDMTNALIWGKPIHPEMKAWIQQALSISKYGANSNAYLEACLSSTYYYIFNGEFSECMALITEAKKIKTDAPLQLIESKAVQSMCYNLSADFNKQALQTAMEASKMAEQTGVHVLDPLIFLQVMCSLLNTGEIETAQNVLAEKSETSDGGRVYSSLYHYFSAWCDLLSGHVLYPLANAKKAAQLAEETGIVYWQTVTQALLLLAYSLRGDYDEVRAQLPLVKAIASRSGSKVFTEYLFPLYEAYVAFSEKKDSVGLESLRKALKFARDAEYCSLNYFWDRGAMGFLCMKALEHNIETECVRKLILKLKLEPEEAAVSIEQWPWPVKIKALGSFELMLDDKPVSFSGKVQKKPLAFLKALITFGGTEVPEENISDALWPDSEGDAARVSLKGTLHRLRTLLGRDDAILYQEGRLSLNRRCCFVDVWSFERLLNAAERTEKTEELQKALILYRGPFLEGEDDKPWAIPLRERLQSKFIRAITKLAEMQERSGNMNEAVFWYQKGLETDALSEELYQRLMVCYHSKGCKAEAMQTYERCRKALSTLLHIEPSEKTEAIYRSLGRTPAPKISS